MVQHPRQSVSSHYRPQPVVGYPTSPPGRHPARPSLAGQAPLPRPAGATSRTVVLAGGGMLALAALWVTPNLSALTTRQAAQDDCIKLEQGQNFLSRDRLKQLLAIAATAPKDKVREVLHDPYCVLEPGPNPEGVQAEREAYPLEFDPNTWLVVFYDKGQYVGYDFHFRP